MTMLLGVMNTFHQHTCFYPVAEAWIGDQHICKEEDVGVEGVIQQAEETALDLRNPSSHHHLPLALTLRQGEVMELHHIPHNGVTMLLREVRRKLFQAQVSV